MKLLILHAIVLRFNPMSQQHVVVNEVHVSYVIREHSRKSVVFKQRNSVRAKIARIEHDGIT